jgi:hypothetical protein
VRKHRWMAGLLLSFGMVLSLAVLAVGPASAQTTGSTTPNTTSNSSATTVLGGGSGSGSGTGGTTLAHTGANSALPLELAGGLITIMLVGAGLLKKTRLNS